MEPKEVKTSHVCEWMKKAVKGRGTLEVRVITIGGDAAICPFCDELIKVTPIK